MAINQSCQEKYGLVGLDGAANVSNDQIAYYCPLFVDYEKFGRSIDFALGLSMAITGAVGLVNNVLTFLTFSNGSAFVGPSFLYHKAMALIELLHMGIMLQYGVLRAMDYPAGNTYWMVWWRDFAWGGWMIGNAAKMAVNCLITFVSLERMIGVWFPLQLEYINRNGVVITCIIISTLIGSLNLPAFASGYIVLRGTDYVHVFSDFGNSLAFAEIQNSLNVIKSLLGGITFASCVLVALGMYRTNKKAAKMSSSAKERWRGMKMGCYLQLVLGITTVVTHVAYVWFQVINAQPPYPFVGRLALLHADSFDQVLADVPRARYLRAVEMVNAVFTSLDHGGRFFFYLLFHATFRANFKNDVLKQFRRTKVQSVVANRQGA